MKNLINENISKFIKENEDSGIVKQLHSANKEGDENTFVILLDKIRDIMEIQAEIEDYEDMIRGHERMIETYKLDVTERKKELKNELYYYKIARV